MVAIANERAKCKNIENVEFAVEDMTKSDFPVNSFDIIYSRLEFRGKSFQQD